MTGARGKEEKEREDLWFRHKGPSEEREQLNVGELSEGWPHRKSREEKNGPCS